MFQSIRDLKIRYMLAIKYISKALGKNPPDLSLGIQSKCGKIQAIITPNTDTFYAVKSFTVYQYNMQTLFIEQ